MKHQPWGLFFCFVLLCLGPRVGFSQDKPSEQDSQRPNILWIVSEDNSASYLGCYGNKQATTPHLDRLAAEGFLYENAFSPAPVCAPTRSTLITGVYANALGTQHMRSTYPIPEYMHFYAEYFRKAGYYCTNHAKKDYNTVDQPAAWDESSNKATYRNRQPGQPFFAVINLGTTHESSIHKWISVAKLKHDPEKIRVPAYLPSTPEVKHDLAQYYDKMQEMDEQVGAILARLKKDGLADNTIVFYYGDNGGILPRSKRFMFESGLRIPLIIYFPKKYQDLAPGKPGTRIDRLVNFVDLPPTVLSLAGLKIPGYMQGHAFLGPQKTAAPPYAYGFRGRMDECYDMIRSVRDKRYRYIRNYMPNRLYGQHLHYLWLAPSMQSWEKAYKAGKCNPAQSAFFKPKPPEELYDVKTDPDNVHNLAGDPKYHEVLLRMRKANARWVREIHDAGFMPEAMMAARAAAAHTTIYQYVRSGSYPQEKIISMAEIATMPNPDHLPQILKGLSDADPAVRYWAAYGCALLKDDASAAKVPLRKLLDDPYPDVAIAAAEALYDLGEHNQSLDRLKKALRNANDKVRLHALNVIRSFGKGALPLLPVLKAQLVQPQPVKGETYGMRLLEAFVPMLESDQNGR